MKNIYVLPTDKPSRLGQVHEKLSFFKDRTWDNTENWRCKNIYITSDEEIKEGWYITNESIIAKLVNPTELDLRTIETLRVCKKVFKIIITDNEDLIKDGVQAIDDEFLEWFVKNPSCESVEVEEEKKAFDNEHRGIPFALDEDDYVKKIYKIIIPKEEPFIEYTNTNDCTSMIYNPKEETLEEDLLNTAIQVVGDNNITTIKEFLVKHKWQAERRYSEEEVRKMLFDLGDVLFNNCQNGIKEGEPEEYFDVIIEQFKKK